MFPTASPTPPSSPLVSSLSPIVPLPSPHSLPTLLSRSPQRQSSNRLPPRPPTVDSSAFYFTLQTKRDPIQYRSFLSLDLAESQSLRSASLKRKESAISKRTSHSSRLDSSKHPTIPEVPPQLTSSPSPSPLRLRYSRDSLRTLPSPKPAPSLTLPDLPLEAHSPRSSNPPRLPSLLPLPSLELPLKPAYPSLLPGTSSTVSTRVKKINRSDALARLEGRSKSADVPSVKPPLQRRNFMSMSDDEDEDESDHNSLDFFDEDDKLGFTLIEPEDIVLPSVADLMASQHSAHARKSSIPSLASRRRRNNTSQSSKDWHPLKSFIDLRNDDEPSRWSWRSFIEVATVV
ncbi:hypothetical protein BDQ17DRAFT_1540593 [Cyathus striatus]|nr:hypothetical protein BDQ17DRAFT_1540593 [Cyathus striatus]